MLDRLVLVRGDVVVAEQKYGRVAASGVLRQVGASGAASAASVAQSRRVESGGLVAVWRSAWLAVVAWARLARDRIGVVGCWIWLVVGARRWLLLLLLHWRCWLCLLVARVIHTSH